jgi:hypothetical protein
MPKLRNVVTGVVKDLPQRYVGLYPYELVEDVVVEGYKSPAIDADGDGMIQDGTPFERPVDTELTVEEQKAAVKKTTKKSK